MVADRFKDSQEKLEASRGESLRSRPLCAESNCASPAAATLHQRAWCVEHFVAQCYQALERMERLTSQALTPRGPACEEARAFLDECSLQTLRVCLGSENLNNLERGRLLDVLLWAGELSGAVRMPATKFEHRIHNGASKSATAAS
jgi:hypothetical protein